MEIMLTTELWEWQGKDAWCFVTLPIEYSEYICSMSILPKRGFGSVKVEVVIGKTTWKTSIFPDTKSKSYVLPVKKDVRKSEGLKVGDRVTVNVRVLEV